MDHIVNILMNEMCAKEGTFTPACVNHNYHCLKERLRHNHENTK